MAAVTSKILFVENFLPSQHLSLAAFSKYSDKVMLAKPHGKQVLVQKAMFADSQNG